VLILVDLMGNKSLTQIIIVVIEWIFTGSEATRQWLDPEQCLKGTLHFLPDFKKTEQQKGSEGRCGNSDPAIRDVNLELPGRFDSLPYGR